MMSHEESELKLDVLTPRATLSRVENHSAPTVWGLIQIFTLNESYIIGRHPLILRGGRCMQAEGYLCVCYDKKFSLTGSLPVQGIEGVERSTAWYGRKFVSDTICPDKMFLLKRTKTKVFRPGNHPLLITIINFLIWKYFLEEIKENNIILSIFRHLRGCKQE